MAGGRISAEQARAVVDGYKAGAPDESSVFSLLREAGWDRWRRERVADHEVAVVSLTGVESFAVAPHVLGPESLTDVHGASYTADVGWLVAFQPGASGGLHLGYSLWRNTDFQQHRQFVPWSDLYGIEQEMTFLSPSMLLANGARDRAAEYVPRNHWMERVNAHLFMPLQGWRMRHLESAASSGSAEAVADLDNQVFRLLSRLILVRLAEDKTLMPAYTTDLRTAAEGGWPAVYRLLQAYDEHFDGSVFAGPIPTVDKLIRDDLRDVVAALYWAPDGVSPLQFQVSRRDLIGVLYSEYVATRGKIRDRRGSQRLLFSEAYTVSRLKEAGMVYTPAPLAAYLAQGCRKAIRTALLEGRMPRIVDPACGSGTLLVAAYRILRDEVAHVWPDMTEGELAERASREALSGWDSDAMAVEVARLNLAVEMGLSRQVLENLNDSVRVLNVVSADVNDLGKGSWDAVIMNPPFVSRQTRSAAGISTNTMRQSSVMTGKYDMAYAFIALATDLMRPDGQAALVAPSILGVGKDATEIRRRLHRYVRSLVSFADQRVFPTADTYTMLAFLEQSSALRDEVPVREYRWLGSDVFEQALALATETGLSADLGLAPVPASARLRADGSTWTVVPDVFRELFSTAAARTKPLQAIAACVEQGCKTGDDFVFVVTRQTDGRYFSRASRRVVELEPDAVHPVLRGHGLGAGYVAPLSDERVVFPYDDGGAELAWENLCDRYPKVARYLEEHKVRLSRRNARMDKWWQWAHVARDAFGSKIYGPDYAAFPKFVLDMSGDRVPLSGSVIKAHGDEMLALCAVLNSPMFWIMLQGATPVRKANYRGVGATYIRRALVPALGGCAVDTLAALVRRRLELGQGSEAAALEARIAAVVDKLYGVSTEERVQANRVLLGLEGR